MIVFQSNTKIYIYNAIVDMRKSIDTLSVLIVEELEKSPQTGDVYLFRGKSDNKIKPCIGTNMVLFCITND